MQQYLKEKGISASLDKSFLDIEQEWRSLAKTLRGGNQQSRAQYAHQAKILRAIASAV